eukprot:3314150-Pleurochrysis_carterae.AAC.2
MAWLAAKESPGCKGTRVAYIYATAVAVAVAVAVHVACAATARRLCDASLSTDARVRAAASRRRPSALAHALAINARPVRAAHNVVAGRGLADLEPQIRAACRN